MSLQSKSFLIYKGDTLENIAQFLQEEIGLNAFLIKTIKGVSLSTTVTQITLLFESYPTDILDSIAPREGAIFASGVASNDFDLRFLFNDPVDFRSIQSGTFSIDGIGLDTDRVYLDPGSNDYFLKVSASGANFQSDAFHTYQLSTSLKRRDGSTFSYTPVGGYVFHTLSSAHIGDYNEPYIGRRRGSVAVAVVRLSKGINPQLGISEFLSQRELSDDRLIAYTPISTSTNTVDIYFIYIDKLEPQIISGFPLNNSLLPEISAPGKVTFVFNTPLDKAKLSSTAGLFSIEEGFSTSTSVPPSKVTLLDDLQTVEIDTSTYFTSQKIYSILARPGILSLGGLAKEKPEQWTIHIASYEGSTNTGEGATGVSQETFDILAASFSDHSGETIIHYTQAEIDISTGQINDLPPLVSVPEYLNFSGSFVTHTGETGVHYTQAEISITEGQISDFGTYATTPELDFVSGQVSAHETSTSNPHSVTAGQVGSPTVTQFTGHTGETGVHYTLAEISITESQITNLGAYASGQDLIDLSGELASHTGNTSNPHSVTAGQVGSPTTLEFTGHTGETGVHFTEFSIDHGNILSIGTNTHNQIDTHINTPSLHFTVGSIEITESQISDFKTYTEVVDADVISANLDTVSGSLYSHSGDLTIHYTQGNIDHSGILNIGVYTHAQIDASIIDFTGHTGNSSIHPTLIDNLSDVSITSASDGQVLTYAAGTWVNDTVSGGGGGSGYLRVPFYARGDSNITLTNQTDAVQFLSASNRNVTLVDLSSFTQARLIARVMTASASANDPHLSLDYALTFSTSVSAYSGVGTSLISAPLDTVGVFASSWINLAPAAIADNVYLSCMMSGGDSAADPACGNIHAEFK